MMAILTVWYVLFLVTRYDCLQGCRGDDNSNKRGSRESVFFCDVGGDEDCVGVMFVISKL